MLDLDFIGVGMPRCATTWLLRSLSAHPKICGSKLKEVPFFNEKQNFQKGLDFYRQFFEHCDPSITAGEFNPQYIHDSQSSKRIANTFPDVQIIISLRDPLAALYSEFTFLASRGRVKETKFSTFIENNPEYISRYNYFDLMKPYLKRFPENQISIVEYPEIENNPQEVLNTLYASLGVNKDFTPEFMNTKIHTSEKEKSSFAIKYIFRIHDMLQNTSWGKKIITQLKLSKLGQYISDSYQVQKQRKGTHAKPNMHISETMKQKIQDNYRDQIASLERHLGRSLNL